jgi:hypothetical protein
MCEHALVAVDDALYGIIICEHREDSIAFTGLTTRRFSGDLLPASSSNLSAHTPPRGKDKKSGCYKHGSPKRTTGRGLIAMTARTALACQSDPDVNV